MVVALRTFVEGVDRRVKAVVVVGTAVVDSAVVEVGLSVVGAAVDGEFVCFATPIVVDALRLKAPKSHAAIRATTRTEPTAAPNAITR